MSVLLPSLKKSFFFWYFSAEFIIDLAKKNNSFDGFKRELRANDADFSVSGCAAVIGLLTSCQLKCR